MMRKFLSTNYLIPAFAGVALTLVGCSGTAADDDDASVAASPTPTPTPTAPPFDDWFRVTEMLVGTSSEGVDVDQDGDVDNGISDTLAVVNTTIYDTIEPLVCAADGDETCSAQEKQIMKLIQQALDSFLTVEALSKAVNNPIQSGAVNYLCEYKEQSVNGNVDLGWNTGTFKNTGWAVGKSLGKQAGSALDASGADEFGPGDLTLSFTFGGTSSVVESLEPTAPTPPTGGGSGFSVSLTLHSGFTTVAGYNATKLSNVYTGGAILEADLIEVVNKVIEGLNTLLESQDQDPIDIDAVDAQIETALEPFADITVDGGPAFSIGLKVQEETVDIVQ